MSAAPLGQRRARRWPVELRSVASLLRRFKRQLLVLLLLLISGCTVSSTPAFSAEERLADRRGHACRVLLAAHDPVVVRQAFDATTTRSVLPQPTGSWFGSRTLFAPTDNDL
ncbi:hypothetical protein ACVCH0_00725 [Burkholderia glumae]|uniref:hypothetical protein n=1 Tax=Burkholderia glumae TaxID=337 RepID=UPI00131FD766|nr:hypothetical protein [Burkholderia glumae]QHE14272.1 hypothetical protein GQR88_28555 [Burkholderia glumae AU6208]